MLHGIGQGLRRGGDRAGGGRAGAARHDRRDQRDPRGQGRHRRPGHHQGLPAGAADRPLVRARRAGRLDHLAQARAAGRRWRTPSRSTSGSPATAPVIRELDDADVRAQLDEARRPRHPGARRLPDQLLRRPRAREADRRDRRRGAARRPGLAVLGRAAGAARVRAHAHHRRQRLRPAAGEALHRRRCRTSSPRAASPASWPSCAATAACSRPPPRSARRSPCCCPARPAA